MTGDPIRSVTFYANGATVYENGVAGTATSVGIKNFPVNAPDPSSFTAYVGNASKTVSFEKDGYVFSEWNTAADGTGTSFQIGDLIANNETSYLASDVYAIWKLPPVAYITDSDELTSIADAIRAKGGTSAALVYPAGFVSAINDIPTGGGGGGVSISPYFVRVAKTMPTMSDWTVTAVKAATDMQGNMYLTSETKDCGGGQSAQFTDLAMVDGYVYITLCGHTDNPMEVYGLDTYNPQTYFDTVNGNDHLFMIQPTENTGIDFM